MIRHVCMGTTRKQCGKVLGFTLDEKDAISHGLCPQCAIETREIYEEELRRIKEHESHHASDE